MISDILELSIEQFMQDCLQLCEQQYPTIHNRGMREQHIAKALLRRIQSGLQQRGIEAEISQPLELKSLFKITTTDSELWLVAHHFLSANLATRKALIETIDLVVQQPKERGSSYLLLMADHWFDRTKASKELPAWWLDEQPEDWQDYLHSGVRLLPADETLSHQLSQNHYPLLVMDRQLHHPLIHIKHQTRVKRYVVMSGLYQLR
ncbi:hypothetical protein ACPV38_05325 [Photobacterium damselae]|uniref:hypothetical protein n=1 Tax=Photobacterium damselae TaxID=38293 RepID=UPI0040682300